MVDQYAGALVVRLVGVMVGVLVDVLADEYAVANDGQTFQIYGCYWLTYVQNLKNDYHRQTAKVKQQQKQKAKQSPMPKRLNKAMTKNTNKTKRVHTKAPENKSTKVTTSNPPQILTNNKQLPKHSGNIHTTTLISQYKIPTVPTADMKQIQNH